MATKKNSKIRQSARGADCQIRIPEVCSFNSEQTVLCHLGGAGIAIKRNDALGAHGCYECHQVVDGHVKSKHSREDIKLWFYEGIFRTQELLIQNGLLNES